MRRLEPILQMEKDVNEDHKDDCTPSRPAVDVSFPDPKAQFELWLGKLKPGQADDGNTQAAPIEDQAADFFVECDLGTNCRIEFTGVLSVGGYFSGRLHTEKGTLITRARGRINAEIDVTGEAFIDSAVKGNINATGRVVLRGNARVIGNISAPALSIKRGAIFEGDCLFKDDLGNEIEAPNYRTGEAIGPQPARID